MKHIPKIKFSQLLASVKDDLRKYADEGLIDSSRLIKVVHRCNDILGVNIYDHKQVVVDVENGQADLPLDFYKMELAFAIGEQQVNTGLIDAGVKKDYVVNQPKEDACKPACICDAGTTVCVYPVNQPQVVLKYNTFTPLTIGTGIEYFAGHSPNRKWSGYYGLDLEEDTMHLGFAVGKVFMSYLADLVDPTTGELLVPFHGRLNDYYEYSIKAKIFEDLMLNTEADVFQAYQHTKRERNLAFSDAVDFVMSKSYQEWRRMAQRREQEFYNQYYKMF